MSKRTPGPYSTRPGDRRRLARGQLGGQFVRGPGGLILAEVFDDERDPDRMGADAAFIVVACNAFDALVAALEAAQAELVAVEELIYRQEGLPAPTVLRIAVERVRELLAALNEPPQPAKR
jgi:hypothetical protein